MRGLRPPRDGRRPAPPGAVGDIDQADGDQAYHHGGNLSAAGARKRRPPLFEGSGARNGDKIGGLDALFSGEICFLLPFKLGRVPVEKERVRGAPASGVMGKPKERTECRTVV
jgi:hypothetical protein